MAFKEVQYFNGEFVLVDCDRVQRHEVAHEAVGDFGVRLKMADEIAVGENAEELTFFVGHNGGAGPDVGHGLKNGANSGVGRDHGEGVAGAHDLVNPEQQAAPDHSGRVKPGEILLLKSARLEQ